jgi:hypothetical protein
MKKFVATHEAQKASADVVVNMHLQRIERLEERLALLERFITNGSLQWATETQSGFDSMLTGDNLTSVIKDTIEGSVSVSGSFTLHVENAMDN